MEESSELKGTNWFSHQGKICAFSFVPSSMSSREKSCSSATDTTGQAVVLVLFFSLTEAVPQ